MKDFSLSLLSRGCGQVIQTQMDSQGGRIEVCFEPEDYFNWKSQQPELRLSDSGRIRCGVEPAPPKTYSTRKGPLLLYSADLALPANPDGTDRKRQGCQHSAQEAELQMRTLRDLTGAILAYDRKQVKYDGRNAHPYLPPSSSHPQVPPINHLSQTWHPRISSCDSPPDAVHNHSRVQPVTPNSTPCHLGDEAGFYLRRTPYMVHNSPLPPIPEGAVKNWGETDPLLSSEENHKIPLPEDLEDQTKNLHLKILLETARVQMSPIPETERVEWGSNSGNTRDQQKEPVVHHVTGCTGYQGADGKCSVTGAGKAADGPCPLKTAFVDSSWTCSRLSHVTYYGGHLSGARLGHTCVQDRKGGAASDSYFSTVHLPPIGPLLKTSGPLLKPRPLVWSGPERGDTKVMKSDVPMELDKQGETIHLPPLCDSNVTMEASAHKHPPSPRIPIRRCSQRELHKKMLLLPLLGHDHNGVEDFFEESTPDEENAKIGDSNRVSSPTAVIQPTNREPSPTPVTHPKNRGSSPTPIIHPKELDLECLGLPEPGEEDVSLGVLPPLGGRKGPGKQSSMALYRQEPLDPHDLCDPHNLQTGSVRGSLPVELREWQKGNAVGTLIMGPDGEIIQLSFWGPAAGAEGQQVLDDITGETELKASEVIQEQPWTFLLQTDTGSVINVPHAQKSPSFPNKQCGLQDEDRKARSHIQKDGEEDETLHPVHEEQCPVLKRAMETPPAVTPINDEVEEDEEGIPSVNTTYVNHTNTHTGQQGTGEIKEGTKTLQPETQKSARGPLSREEAINTDTLTPGLSTGEGKTIGSALSDMQDPKTTNGSLRRPKSQYTQEQVQTSLDVDSKEAKRIRADQKVEGDTKSRKKEVREDWPLGKSLTQETADPNVSMKKTKGSKEKSENISSLQAKKKKKIKQRAQFVVGKARESVLERPAEERMDRAGAKKKLDMVKPDAVAKDKEQQQESRSSSSILGKNMNDDGLPRVKLHTPASHSDRVNGPDRPCSSDCLTEAACPDPLNASTASMKSQSSAASLTKSQSPAASMMKSRSPVPSITDSQLSLKATTREPPHVHLVNLDASSNIDGGGGKVMTRREQQEAERAARAEQRRMEVERKRAQRDEQRKRQQEKEEREERLKQELLEEQQRRAEELRLRKLREQEEKQQQEEQEKEHWRREQAEREKERKRQEEKKRQMERFLKMRQEEEERRAAELERLRVEEEAHREEERRRLLQMEESERQAYLLQRQKEEAQRRLEEEERKRREEEAALARQEAMLQLARQRAALEQKLKFHCGVLAEGEALSLTQSISRPWVYSYFRLLKLLGLHRPTTALEGSASETP
ncbi:hypothetical protein AGOR_G00070900 [Albula goreensis]|uniref:Uncharacterized protein n=1 Tax=Albula goreensis TaxID=1534307 RepID=A0A8T3DQ03_9TELE|nr:hypothetical protein AGOR_G00070900 [Albula goreensis]